MPVGHNRGHPIALNRRPLPVDRHSVWVGLRALTAEAHFAAALNG